MDGSINVTDGRQTSSSFTTFVLAVVAKSHIWKRAQAEIDAVLNMDRLPDFNDRPSLPYVEAILRETTRRQPVIARFNFQRFVLHAALNSDIYKGFHRPYVSRDGGRCPNAEQFVPEKFLTGEGALNEDDPSGYIFGFGRLLCPGRHLHVSLANSVTGRSFTPPDVRTTHHRCRPSGSPLRRCLQLSTSLCTRCWGQSSNPRSSMEPLGKLLFV
ncbi:cytochrome P450 [Paxillus ammoniavirescens]|nr:cytochrome P450 [Paxillus ammoniavirescens]